MKGKKKKPAEPVGTLEDNAKSLATAAGEVVEALAVRKVINALGELDSYSAKAVLTVALSMVEAKQSSMTGRYALRFSGADAAQKALTPSSNSAELHLTYACDLECSACTRSSFLREPHTAPLTIADVEEFFRQARELDWVPGIVITGGEPTMHPDFLAIVSMALEFTHSTGKSGDATETAGGNHVQVFSNGHRERARRLAEDAERIGASICRDTNKLAGSVTGPDMFPGWVDDVFVSPADLGKPLRPPCYQHASQMCGVSVDHDGYSPCSPGGAIDALLGVGGRTKVLADLFDPERVAAMTAALCKHCGVQGVVQKIFAREQVDAQPKRFGVPMSPTWVKAFDGRR